MSVTNKRWENQTITPKHDSIQFDNGQNGILYGCEITHLGSNILRMAAGYIVLCGRLIEVDQTDINCEVASSGTTNGQMIIRLNLGAVDSVEIITEAASSLTPLTQNEDANYEDGIYEIQLAQYTISETVLSDLTVTAPVLEKLGTEVNTIKEKLTTFHYRNVDGQRQVSDDGVNWENFSSGAELLWTNPAPNSNFLAQKINVDLSNYESVLIQYKDYESANKILGIVLNKGITGYALISNELYYINMGIFRYREITEISNTGIAFGNGQQGSSQFDNLIIPYKIFGLKKLD